jgi:hypothetical protein
LSSVASSAFGDLVFPCRTECPDEPICKLKIGGIIAAVSVPLAMKPTRRGDTYGLIFGSEGQRSASLKAPLEKLAEVRCGIIPHLTGASGALAAAYFLIQSFVFGSRKKWPQLRGHSY